MSAHLPAALKDQPDIARPGLDNVDIRLAAELENAVCAVPAGLREGARMVAAPLVPIFLALIEGPLRIIAWVFTPLSLLAASILPFIQGATAGHER